MSENRRENARRFIPTEGRTYENAGGGTYLCKYVRKETCDAWMQNTASGWTCLAHGIVRYEDGTIEWDYSTCGHFEKLPEASEIYSLRRETAWRQSSLLNAMLCCMI